MTREKAILHMILRREELKNSVSDLDEDIKAFDMAIQYLDQNRWIPVSERLPEKNMECLVTVGDFNLVQTAMYSNLMRTIDHRIFYQGECGDETFKNITWYVKAWMPLPQPYKAESEE